MPSYTFIIFLRFYSNFYELYNMYLKVKPYVILRSTSIMSTKVSGVPPDKLVGST